MSARWGAAAALAVAGAFTMSCSGVVDPSKNVTETFTGTIQVQGSHANAFSTSKSGEFSLKVTSLTPPTGSFFGVILALGSGGATCVGNLPIIQQNPFATVNVVALSGAILPGNYCVYVYDIGAFTTAETYTLQVSHP